MNSPEIDKSLDELFRASLSPLSEAKPPAGVWRRVVSTIQASQPSHGLAAQLTAVDTMPPLCLSYGQRLFSWINGLNTIYFPPTSGPISLELGPWTKPFPLRTW